MIDIGKIQIEYLVQESRPPMDMIILAKNDGKGQTRLLHSCTPHAQSLIIQTAKCRKVMFTHLKKHEFQII